jgi:hypothetical protein
MVLRGVYMEIELKLNINHFKDVILKMAVPLNFSSRNSSKKEFFHSIIFPKFTPIYKNNSYTKTQIEWLAKTDVNVWIEYTYIDFIEPIDSFRIPIESKNILAVLDEFTDSEYVYFTHSDEKGMQILTDKKTSFALPITAEEPDFNSIFDGYPGKLDENGVVLFQEGTLKPDIYGTCKVENFKRVISAIKKYSPKKENDVKYNFSIDGDNHIIKVYNDRENIRTGIYFSKTFQNKSIHGTGELHYIFHLPAVVNVLSGEFSFYTTDCGPLWITQDLENIKIRYLIPGVDD